jgi:hypothetical protein
VIPTKQNQQTIYSKMLEKAKSYPDKADQEKYLAAANRWRLPYWDYHRPRGGKVTFPGVVNGGTTGTNFHVNLPLIFTAPNIMVHEPGNKGLTPHSNPFLSYNFPKTSSQDRIPDIQWETVGKWARNPDGVGHAHVLCTVIISIVDRHVG